MITVYSIHTDHVIEGKFLVCETTYEVAVNVLIKLINKLDLQRNLQKSKLYERLGRDLVKGCIMPPLTLAFLSKHPDHGNDITHYSDFINENIPSAFVLDGIQRLNTLQRTYGDVGDELDLDQPLFLDIIICESKDKLLYRMITLNNGQKPMSARHQIEILAEHFLAGKDVPISIQSEKEKLKAKSHRAYKKADIVKGYIAYITGLLNYDNQKIIEEKMDELIAERVLEYNVTADSPEFVKVLEVIAKFTSNEELYDWFSINNNLIGFCVGIRKTFHAFEKTTIEEFRRAVTTFNNAFGSIDVSQIKLSKERRKLAQHFIEHYPKTKDYSETDFISDFLDLL